MLYRVFCVLFCLFVSLVVSAGEPTLAYKFGIQDEFTVTVQKHPELSGAYTVPPDGVIDFPRAGRLLLTGKTAAEIADALRIKYDEILVEPQVTVVLTKARTRMATIMGAVAKPAQYQISDTTRISDLIALAGDVVGDINELTANLQRGTTLLPIRLESVLKGKDPNENLLIQEGDQLTVIAPVKITVVVIGQVKNPNPFKLREGSTVVDALAQAGDVTGRPERLRIHLLRGAQKQQLQWGDITTRLCEGDVISVENEPVVRVTVNGEVKNCGAVDLLEGGGVMEAIALAGGVLPTAALSQITIIRADKPEAEAVEHVNLSQAFSQGAITSNPRLNPGDQVLVPKWEATVSVFGMVTKVGAIPISESQPFTVLDAISQAGVDKRAKLSGVVIVRKDGKTVQQIPVNVRDIMKKKEYDKNIPLKAGDIIYVPDSGTKVTDILPWLSSIGILVL